MKSAADLPDGPLQAAQFGGIALPFQRQWIAAKMPTTGVDDMVFLVAGYDDENAPYGRIYEMHVPSRPKPLELLPGTFGAAWGGQRELTDRLLQGFDPQMPMSLARKLLWLARASFLLLLCGTACSTTFHGVKAVSPEPPRSDHFPEVDSLQPTLQWEPSARSGATYDLTVNEVNKEESFWKGTQRSVGKEAYYREGLKEAVHRIEQPLEPDREYVWAVRLRQGDQVGSWSTYSFFNFYVLAWTSGKDMVYRFRTPAAKVAAPAQ